MSIAQLPTTLVTSQPTVLFSLPQLLSTSAYHEVPPWKYSVLSKLHEFESAPSATHVAEGLLVSQSTAMFARAVLGRIDQPNLPNPVVCPVPGDSLGIVWTVGLRQLEAIFAPDATGSYVLSNGEEIVEDGDLTRDTVKTFERALTSILTA